VYQPEIKEYNIRALYQLKLRTKNPITRLINAILDAFFGQLEELEWGGADAIIKSRDDQIRSGNIQISFLKKDADGSARGPEENSQEKLCKPESRSEA
jgi:hypothetical protein